MNDATPIKKMGRNLYPDPVVFSDFFAPVRMQIDLYDCQVEEQIPEDLNAA